MVAIDWSPAFDHWRCGFQTLGSNEKYPMIWRKHKALRFTKIINLLLGSSFGEPGAGMAGNPSARLPAA